MPNFRRQPPGIGDRSRPARHSPANTAFIDAQNVHRGVHSLGWDLDWSRFRLHLERSYGVSRAYVFLGYVRKNAPLYESLQRCGYTLIFKPVIPIGQGRFKGNVDAELVLQAMIDIDAYDRAVIVTSDGDFACLVRHLRSLGKLRAVLSPCRETCSTVLRRAAQGSIAYMDGVREMLEFQKRQKAP